MFARLSIRVCVCALLSIFAVQNVHGEIRWRSGPSVLPRKAGAELENALSALAARQTADHVVVQFDGPLALDQRAQLEAAGLQLLNYLGDHAFFAKLSAERLDTAALAAVPTFSRVEPIQRVWKLHEDLARGDIPAWSVVTPPEKQAGGNTDLIIAVYILFHPDVRLDPDGVRLCHNHGAVLRSKLETINGLVIELPLSAVGPLADEDAVQWIEPPLPRFSTLNDDNRLRTGADIVQAPPFGLDGTGVTVMIYDAGFGLASHQDFGGRLTARDTSGLVNHSTHVAGTVGGSGAASGGTYRGMAPAVLLEAYGFEQVGGLHQGFLYTDPGDLEVDYNDAINVHGADIANNSIGTNTAPNGFPCSWEGNYGVTANLIDAIVKGSLGAPFRIVWANGNERQGGAVCGATYHTTAPPACAKNHITVGALNSNDDSVTSFTSWGPADDGRLKPDLSGPGCQLNADGGVTSTSSSGGYTVMCGTSMASPTVCGLGALLLQDYRANYPGLPDFRNSTLKAVLAHTALDVENPGPDYKSGYGSVRIQPAVELMRAGNFIEDIVDQGATFSVLAVVNAGQLPLKATLAWDDVPGTPDVIPSLVNDLDLRVFDVSNVQSFPWTLDPNNPSVNAVRTQPDHVNNIEQVVIDLPQPGVYRIDVVGFNVPQGPQPFSLTVSPMLVACAPSGVASLDRSEYMCSSTATLRVVDCDLNTSNTVIDTVTVTIASTSEPAGESVVLTETAAETAAFEGTIPLSMTDAPGVLLIAEGDVVTTTYIDADNGQGGINVTVTATATVDCTSPVVSGVQSTATGPRDATITFNTDEPANAVVNFGLGCAATPNMVPESGFDTVHTFNLTNLTDNTAYFFTVQAADAAGNPVFDDNGGLCYTFVTPQVPDFFTEEFAAQDNDLDNLTTLFSPNGTIDFYSACTEPITALPTDPTGGTTISLSDDSSQSISLAGGATVSFYGTTYSSFFVGSNGYITFGIGDTDWTESLADHFSLPRISALFDDLNPSAGGTVSWQQFADRAVVTYQNVPEFSTTNQNTFQVELYFNGDVRISYMAIAATDGISGLSEGNGLSPDFLETDLSLAATCITLPPIAYDANTFTPVDTPLTITLAAVDDGAPNPPGLLNTIITALPAQPLTDAGDAHVILPAELPYTLFGGGNQVTYSPAGGFTGFDTLQFQSDDGGTPPDGGPSNVATVSISVGGPRPIHEFLVDDTDPNWIGFTLPGSWEFGSPQGLSGDPSAGFSGVNVYGYNLGGNYPNNMVVSYLKTTPIDASAMTGTQLQFRRWLGVDDAAFDHASIQVSNDDVNWVTIWQHTGAAINETSWSLQTYDISAVADGQATVFIRWGMGPTDGAVTLHGWNLDDIQIWGVDAVPTNCGALTFTPGDANADLLVNGDDIQTFIAIILNPAGPWTPEQQCATDFTGDGTPDTADIAPFVTALLN